MEDHRRLRRPVRPCDGYTSSTCPKLRLASSRSLFRNLGKIPRAEEAEAATPMHMHFVAKAAGAGARKPRRTMISEQRPLGRVQSLPSLSQISRKRKHHQRRPSSIPPEIFFEMNLKDYPEILQNSLQEIIDDRKSSYSEEVPQPLQSFAIQTSHSPHHDHHAPEKEANDPVTAINDDGNSTLISIPITDGITNSSDHDGIGDGDHGHEHDHGHRYHHPKHEHRRDILIDDLNLTPPKDMESKIRDSKEAKCEVQEETEWGEATYGTLVPSSQKRHVPEHAWKHRESMDSDGCVPFLLTLNELDVDNSFDLGAGYDANAHTESEFEADTPPLVPLVEAMRNRPIAEFVVR